MFDKIENPIENWKDYENNNPNIIKRIEHDLINGNPFHYLFTGVVGCGKTFLANHIVNIKPYSEYNWHCVTVKRFYETYLQYIQGNYSDKWDAIKRHNMEFKTKCLFLDDLGDERPATEASHDYFGGLIESRHIYIQRHNESRTIITTNLGANEIISMYGSRVFDRLQEYFVICKFKTTSFREKKEIIIES